VRAAGAGLEQVTRVTQNIPGVNGTGPSHLAYDPCRIAPEQRNAVVTYEELQRAGKISEAGIAHLGQLFERETGVWLDRQLRVILCEGASMLGFLGLFRRRGAENFGRRERRALSRLVPALRERHQLEVRLSDEALHEATLDTVLEAMGQPAWVVDAKGHVLHSNRAGKSALDAERQETQERLRRRGSSLRVADLRGPGLPAYSLLVARGTEASVEARLRDCATAWNLSPRVVEVLRGVVRGLSNVAIARELGVVERTIEVHVSTLLEAARVENRASLIAAVYGGA
jgi:DNA-binding CsgD family transcriptional regulator